MCDLRGRVAFITGGAQGIGRGIALEMARSGSRVVIANRNLEKASETAEEMTRMGHEAIASYLDVTNEETIRNCINEVLRKFSRIDILINNAGVHCERIGHLSTIDDFSRCFDVNLFGVWRMTQALVPQFRAGGGGSIVNIASINGRRPWVDVPAYSASKAALINLTQSLAAMLGVENINVNAVCPGGVMTEMADLFKSSRPDIKEMIINQRVLKRDLLPEDIGRAVVFFSSEYARNITGQALNVDGGVVMS